MARIDIKISGSTAASHVDVQNALLSHLQSTAAGSYTLCSPKGSWDGDTRILHLTADAADVVAARVAEVDVSSCSVEFINLDAPAADVAAEASEVAAEAETAPVAVETTSRRGRRRKF